MRKRILVLAVSTIALAIACVYLYRQVDLERSRADSLTTRVRELTDQVAILREHAGDQNAIPPETLTPPPGTDNPAPTSQPPSTPPDKAAVEISARAKMLAAMRKRYSNPGFRAMELERAKAEARREHSDVGSVVGMDRDKENALIDLLANQQVRHDEMVAMTAREDPADETDASAALNELYRQFQQEQIEFLGEATFQRYQDYRRSGLERGQIRNLRVRLDESHAMTSTQATRLMNAMREERDSYLQQQKSVDGYAGYAAEYPFQALSMSTDPETRIRFAEDDLARTEAFQGRLHARAAAILNPEQLRRFDEMQAEQLGEIRARIERARAEANGIRADY